MSELIKHLTNLVTPTGESGDKYLRTLVFDGIVKRYGNHLEKIIEVGKGIDGWDNEILDRAELELKTIEKLNY